MVDTTNTRLERIETKLDQLTDALVMLARAEERLTGLKDDHDKSFERMNRLSRKLDDIERQVQDNANTVRVINKLFWVSVIAIAGSIAAQYFM